MPIYEFECVPKGHIFDRLQKMDDPDPEVCEVCGEGPVRRRVTAPAFRLAGTGWYETDFKGDKDKRRNLAGEGSSSAASSDSAKSGGDSTPASKDSGSASSTKTDAKPATSSD
ncbi:MAG: zinc ribbon domain-containing protein [Xanthomonadales bacterium]|nr:zinc ribbon domain-containing protein [Xanthomonadales bacterium]